MKNNMRYCLLLFLFLSATSSFADEDKAEQTVPVMDSIKIYQDSLFKIINKSFETVKPMLVYSCYDCHSNTTVEPWYFDLPVVSGFVKGHIDHAQKNLDFSNGFPFKGGKNNDQIHLLHEIKEEVEEGAMPIFSYRFMHWGRLIEGDKQDTLFEWIDNTTIQLKEFYDRYGISYKE
ncbi:MAG: heme-binding domain-containing protein [Flavobacteriales bacterium]|nr:heme-binding domain-containing protein [Flavobacteriales bacterium]